MVKMRTEKTASSYSSTGPQQRLDKFINQSENRTCADCGSPDPKWASLNLGAFICIKCSGAHRSLGVHISKVLSVKLDQWSHEQVSSLVDLGGNSMVNMKYEACIPGNLTKPNPDSSVAERLEFIRRKYELLQFSSCDEAIIPCPFPAGYTKCAQKTQRSSVSSALPSPSTCHQNSNLSEKPATKTRIGHAVRSSWVKKELEHKSSKTKAAQAGMVEFVGLIKVNIVRGMNLAIRDMLTSDPYVIISIGQQSVKTRVIRNNLNPVWNECLMLSIPDDVPPLKVLVYDKDAFKSDDFMGEGEIDIQPLLSTARANEKSGMADSMLLRKWVASEENALVKNSVISLVDGKVKQDVTLRLQKVETGEIDIELECVPLSQ
ncbi:hypothetical protein SAY87_011058 [Trapa incisa]|uniref:ADP-ribosylation factor GTPase-activating protein AGD11 n=2 Tax=Trapa TaxID=22665 RepID=A0AAN7R9D9_TRANT|nr:hypothetical protein SAY87_011058 [Trapa incisa]KAK4794657.1 hypothetical protein SAY86_012651 [Trapa natans]